jgi:acetyl esterase/lipase
VRVVIPFLVAAALLAGAGPAHAGLEQLKAACTPKPVADAPGRSFRFCDDGVPSAGGRTPNPGADRALAVPAAYAGTAGLPPLDPAAAAAIPGSADGTVALDVDVSLPDPERHPKPAGGYPLIAVMHGCCSGSKRSWEADGFDAPGERWHYNNAWWAARGYVVLTWTSRGFVNGSGHGSTGEIHIDAQPYEINDFQHMVGQLVDDPFFGVDPQRIVVTGGSYGGGFTWGALVDPTWKSPGGRDVSLVAAAPKYGWTDLLASLTPTGRHFYDEGPPPATDGSDSGYGEGQKVGIPIRTIVSVLFLSGDLGFPSPPPNNSHTTFPEFIRQAFYCTQSTYPAETNPLCDVARSTTLPAFFANSSPYYRNDFFERLKTDPRARVPVFSAGTLTDPLFPPIEHRRMAERLKATVPGYPIQEYYGDYNHFVQNKAKEWGDQCGEDRHVCRVADHPDGDVEAAPASRVRVGVTTRLNRFVDHYARPQAAPKLREPSFDVTTALQICPANASERFPGDGPGETFTADSFDALTPGRMTLEWDGGGQVALSEASPNTHATAADPVANQVANGARCPVHTDGAGSGVAVYESPPLPRDTTMIGGSILTAGYTATGDLQALQLNARLYDVQPDGSLVMVDRGPRRIDVARDGAEQVTFQLHGNAWRFPEGHKLRIELAADDNPYLHSSDSPFSIALRSVKLEVPVRETEYGLDPTVSPDTLAPRVRLRVRRVTKRRLVARVRCSEACTGRLVVRAGSRRVGRRAVRLTERGARTVRVKLRGLRSAKRVRVQLRVADAAGNAARASRRPRIHRG